MDSRYFTSESRRRSYKYQKILSVVIILISIFVYLMGSYGHSNFRYSCVGSIIFAITGIYLFFSKRIWIY